MLKFVEIKDIKSMIEFLQEKGNNHDNYYHYTTWNSLSEIFKNKTFLLTRGNSLRINDQHEAMMKGSKEEWNKIYIGSFAFGTSEIMAMWGLYGLPWQDAVRLSIPKMKMRQWIDSIKCIKLFKDGQTVDYQGEFEARLNDIVYVTSEKGIGNFRLTHSTRSITVGEAYPFYKIDTAKEMTGYIKNYAWQYENEVRLRIRLDDNTGYERISIDIPNEVIDSIKVVTGPYFKEKHDKLQSQLADEKRIDKSNFKDLVRYKELCEMCQHDFAQKK